jgi:hypothetical protein
MVQDYIDRKTMVCGEGFKSGDALVEIRSQN